MSVYQFGTGAMFGRNTGAGAVGDVGMSPVQFGALQSVEIDFAATNKSLSGTNQFPLAVARGLIKVTGKAKFANLSSKVYNELFWGQTLTAGQTILAINEGPTAIPTSPRTVTAVKTATFVTDYGVKNAATGAAMTKILAGTPAVGQYKVSAAGVYTFSAADQVAGVSVTISYSYTAIGGYTLALSNQVQGYAPIFEVALQNTFQNKTTSGILYQCTASKLTLPTKMEDFVISDFEFEAFTNAADCLGLFTFPE